MKIIKIAYSLPPDLHNDLRFWTLQETGQEVKLAEKMAKEIEKRLRKLNKAAFSQAIEELKFNGWDGLVEWLDRLEVGDPWVNMGEFEDVKMKGGKIERQIVSPW